ncbi:hypothetical protein [Pseudonocardia sp. N23]|uniref:hypothetical protein n=1 Tax=Pseudonocardia sp. N23 TaxID=1987376 RepID=UPI000BFE5E73|nr:hypothetical protein [Pseudonocardia sp. N23]GAY07888.1 hypothetical protein TOK_5306 [Pseudonocardia sp. N23]
MDGRIVMATVEKAPLVSALRSNPVVALTVDDAPLTIIGVAEIEIVDGVPDVYLDGARPFVAAGAWDGFEAGVRALYDRMAVVTVAPTGPVAVQAGTSGGGRGAGHPARPGTIGWS